MSVLENALLRTYFSLPHTAAVRSVRVERLRAAVVAGCVAGEDAFLTAVITGGEPMMAYREAADAVMHRELDALADLEALEAD